MHRIFLISLATFYAAQAQPTPPDGCLGVGSEDTFEPSLMLHIPVIGETIEENPFFFEATVTDNTLEGQNDDCVRRVEWQVRPTGSTDPGQSVRGARDEGTTNVWILQQTLPSDGDWEYRVRMVDWAGNAVRSDWKGFTLTTSPTPQPTPSPTPAPTPAPTASVGELLDNIKNALEDLIDNTPGLAAKLLRLAFHDCVGGCDGCVNLLNPDNAGLGPPIQALQPIVDAHENPAAGISRADIWALAALTAAERAQPNNNRVPFPMQWVGRENCAGDMIVGPDPLLPSPDQTSDQVLHFFFNEFGFDDRQTTALFGAHSIGVLARANSGFDGPNGWDNNNERLDNNYYSLMVGGNDPVNDTIQILVAAPDWTIREVDNTGLNTPNRFQWERNQGGNQIMALNTDIALVRDLENNLNEVTGEVTCTFRGRQRCPHADRTIRIVSEYANDNDLFMNEFRDVFSLMLVHGYDASNPCDDAVCVLQEIM